MRSTLVAMGFGPSFISWVNLFYFHVQSSVNVNGYLSPFFTLLLYALVSEVLTVNIHRNPPFAPGFPFIVSHFPIRRRHIAALDIGRVHKGSFWDVRTVRSGFRCQAESLEVQRPVAGGMVRLFQPPVALDWSSAKLKILGVFISHGNLEEDNWRPRIDAVDHVLTSWRSCSLTFRSKPSSLTLWLSPWSGTWLLSSTCLGGEGAFPFGLFLFLVW